MDRSAFVTNTVAWSSSRTAFLHIAHGVHSHLNVAVVGVWLLEDRRSGIRQLAPSQPRPVRLTG